MKYAIVAILCALAGYFLHPVLNPPPKNKFETFVQTEVKRYAEASDAETKLKAAEEMYGKMMVLFLADLGLRLRVEPVRPVAVEKCPPLIADSIAEIKEEKPVMTGGPEALSDKPNQKVPEKSDTPQSRWARYTSTPYIESFKGADRRMLGRFVGTLTNKNGTEDTVVMNFDLVERRSNIEGETLVLMTDANGKEYSRNSGNGGNRNIKKAENGYYVEASPTSYFLLNLKHYPQVSGKYFERGKFMGDVQLRKISP